jgi:hypothetical protein
VGSLSSVKVILALALALAIPSTADATTLVSFSQSGGIAGRHVTLRVTTRGTAVVGGHKPFRLHASTLHHLRRLLADARFDRVDPKPSQCADCLVYAVRYRGHRAGYDDSQARQVPRSVRLAVGELARIARGGR